MYFNEEEWRAIKDYEGLYEVSNLGRVRSLNYNGTKRVQLLKPQDQGQGYLQVQLRKNKKRRSYRVHRLVAEAFIPNPNNLPCINHIDQNRSNNRVDNLEWCSYEYNNNYGSHNEKISNANSKALKGNQNGAKKVICVELDKEFNSMTKAAKFIGCKQPNITAAIKRNGTCGGYHWKYKEGVN